MTENQINYEKGDIVISKRWNKNNRYVLLEKLGISTKFSYNRDFDRECWEAENVNSPGFIRILFTDQIEIVEKGESVSIRTGII